MLFWCLFGLRTGCDPELDWVLLDEDWLEFTLTFLISVVFAADPSTPPIMLLFFVFLSSSSSPTASSASVMISVSASKSLSPQGVKKLLSSRPSTIWDSWNSPKGLIGSFIRNFKLACPCCLVEFVEQVFRGASFFRLGLWCCPLRLTQHLSQAWSKIRSRLDDV